MWLNDPPIAAARVYVHYGRRPGAGKAQGRDLAGNKVSVNCFIASGSCICVILLSCFLLAAVTPQLSTAGDMGFGTELWTKPVL